MAIVSNAGDSKELVTVIRGSGTYIVPAATTAKITPVAFAAPLAIMEPAASAQIVFPQLEFTGSVSSTTHSQTLLVPGLVTDSLNGFGPRLFLSVYTGSLTADGDLFVYDGDSSTVFTYDYTQNPTIGVYYTISTEGIPWADGYYVHQKSGGIGNVAYYRLIARIVPTNTTVNPFSAIAGSTVTGDEFVVEEYA